eukprot:GHVS01095722.1.p1 GENE.GHVS01095722.1~~GHVS01095722.1.p1  ORF type:complete len:149 (-),score=14.85 GHVS01095722.1:137-583(-)
MCPSKVILSKDGRLEALLTQKPGSTSMTTYKDRTRTDRIKSAQGIIQEILDTAHVKTEKDKQKRLDKGRNWKRKPSHGAALAEIVEEDDDEDDPNWPVNVSFFTTEDKDTQHQEEAFFLMHAPRIPVTIQGKQSLKEKFVAWELLKLP